MPRRSRTIATMLAGAGLVLALAACTGEGAPVSTRPTTASPAPTATGTAAPSAPASAAPGISDAQAYLLFDATNRKELAADSGAKGRDMVDALVAVGFDKKSMQLTPDTTTIGRAVDSIEFSVLWNKTCLIGQIGAGGYTSETAPVLSTGTCLVGTTRTIDW